MSGQQPTLSAGWHTQTPPCPAACGAAAAYGAYGTYCVDSVQAHVMHQQQQPQLPPSRQQYLQQQHLQPPPPQQQQPHTYLPAAAPPPVYVVPVAAPVVATAPPTGAANGNLTAGYSGGAGMGAAGWVYQAGVDCTQPPVYNPLAYHYSTGFWLQGFFFSSYEHLMAYRRCAIAYNYHFFGIRPHFRPPAHLPRPRPPSGSRRGGAPRAPSFMAGLLSPSGGDAAAASAAPHAPLASAAGSCTPCADPGSAAAGVASPPPGEAGSAAKTGTSEDTESQCCSPGGSSTCDSDDVGSDDAGRAEAADPDLLLCEMQQSPSALFPDDDARGAACSTGKAALQGADLGQGREGLKGCPESTTLGPSDCAAAHHLSHTLGCNSTPPRPPLAAARPGTPTGGVTSSPDSHTPTRSRPNAPRSPGSPLLGLGSTLCTSGVLARGLGAGFGLVDAQQRGFDSLHGAGVAGLGDSAPACMCPQWLEPHLGSLLDSVVGEALWGCGEGA